MKPCWGWMRFYHELQSLVVSAWISNETKEGSEAVSIMLSPAGNALSSREKCTCLVWVLLRALQILGIIWSAQWKEHEYLTSWFSIRNVGQHVFWIFSFSLADQGLHRQCLKESPAKGWGMWWLSVTAECVLQSGHLLLLSLAAECHTCSVCVCTDPLGLSYFF